MVKYFHCQRYVVQNLRFEEYLGGKQEDLLFIDDNGEISIVEDLPILGSILVFQCIVYLEPFLRLFVGLQLGQELFSGFFLLHSEGSSSCRLPKHHHQYRSQRNGPPHEGEITDNWTRWYFSRRQEAWPRLGWDPAESIHFLSDQRSPKSFFHWDTQPCRGFRPKIDPGFSRFLSTSLHHRRDVTWGHAAACSVLLKIFVGVR